VWLVVETNTPTTAPAVMAKAAVATATKKNA